MEKVKTTILFGVLTGVLVFLSLYDLTVGSVEIPLGRVVAALCGGDCPPQEAKIVVDIRLAKMLTALLAGAALTVSGLQMQTLFRNPLAGPYVLGVSSGASLAAALYLLGASTVGFNAAAFGTLGMVGAAWVGAAIVLVAIAAIGRRVRDIMVILILGMMISSGISAVVQILQYFSNEDALKSYVIWTMGSLGNVTFSQLPLIGGAVIAGLLLAMATVKPLNLLLLGEDYARTMGLDLRRARLLIFVSTTLLAGTVTAFCGPLGFIGLAMPHVARALFRTANHSVLIPACALTGAVVMVGCDIISKTYTLPVNAITSLIGIPIVIWIVMKASG